MAPARRWAALVGCSAALLALPAAGDVQLGDTSKIPGDANYCVELQSLGTSEGELSPAEFDGQREDYDLTVNNPASKQVVLTFGLQLLKYDIQQTPIIEVDGKRLDYTPLTIISKTINLDDDIGAIDRVVRVVVKDPNPGNIWHHTNSKEYRIHLRQPPEYAKVVMAEELTVTGSSGKEIVAKQPFNPNSSRVDYFYHLPHDETGVTIEFACPKFATDLDYDDTPVRMVAPRPGWSPSGTVQHIDVSQLSLKRITLTCKYSGTVKRARRDYALEFYRDVNIDAAAVRPKLLPDLGYCLSRVDYHDQLGSSYSEKSHGEGYVCLTDSTDPKIMVESDDPKAAQAEVILRDKDSPYQVQLQKFLPVQLTSERCRHRLEMDVKLGNAQRHIPVKFIFPATCDTIFCPRHHQLRSALDRKTNPHKRLCLEEKCSLDNDRDTCCEKLAPCSSMSCPAGKTPASDMDCKGPVCTKEADEQRCCEGHEFCSEVFCPAGSTLRSDAATVQCKSKFCSLVDHSHCCEKQAWCNDFKKELGCPDGQAAPVDIDKRHCLREKCAPEDEAHCCSQQLMSCSSYLCHAGTKLRKDAGNLTCYNNPCKASDAPRCCEKLIHRSIQDLPVKKEVGIVEGINPDGTYQVQYKDQLDKSVPEWALQDADVGGTTSFRKGQKVEAAATEEGYSNHGFSSGWVMAANEDGTYTVKFDNDEWDKHVPAWAVRAVDSKGDSFVHTGMLAEGQRIKTTRQKKGGYKRMEFAVGTVIAKHTDDTFTVQYASGNTDEHVPVWELRGITPNGKSRAMPDFKAGEYVEVSNQEKARQEQFQPSLADRLRTKYVFGYVRKVNPDGTYGIKYDFGGWEDNVPNWAIRKLDKGESQLHMRYIMDDRVEARISRNSPYTAKLNGIVLGIAVRERLHWYTEIGCWPAPEKCQPKPYWAPGVPPDTPQDLPELSDYDTARNPKKQKLCHYDSACETNPDLPGCNAGDRQNCRYCGFGNYSKCPQPMSCRVTEDDKEEDWGPERKEWCCKYFNIGCPFVCRWGKYWPDEAKGWGPWWSPEKRTWCCENKNIGCPRLDAIERIVTTTQPTTTTTITAICEDGFTLSAVDLGGCPDSLDDLDPCESADAGQFCKGTGQCGTDLELNNCGEDGDIYLKQANTCPDDQGVQGYRFAHHGYYVDGTEAGNTASAVECAVECDKDTKCLGFSWRSESHLCATHTELGNRVLGGSSLAFARCMQEDSQMMSLQVKFDGHDRREGEQANVLRGSANGQTWRAQMSRSVFLLFGCTTALALATWSWRASLGCRKRGPGDVATARAFSMVVGGTALRQPPRMATTDRLVESMLSSGEGSDSDALLL